MTDISIIVPIYNIENKIKKCIDSILNQTYKNFELILVNDGSTDSSLEICNNYKRKDTRIKIINKKNQGVILARKSGLDVATGKYIIFIDGDDWVDKDLLKILYNEAEKQDCDIVACNPYLVYGNGLIKKIRQDFDEDITYEKEEIKKYVLSKFVGDTGFPVSVWAKIYKRNLFNDYGEYFLKVKFFGEDLALNMEILPKCKKVRVINKALYYYRCGGGTTKYMKHLFEDITTTYCIQKDCIDKYYFDEKDKRYSRVAFIFLNTYKLVLTNMISSGINKSTIVDIIEKQVKDINVVEAVNNLGYTKNWFDPNYIEAIINSDNEYLYNWAKNEYNRLRYKRIIKNILVKLNI